MKSKIVFGLISLIAGSLLAAESKDEVTQAAKKLGENSYSWKSTMEAGNFNSESEGKTDKEGLVQLKMTFGDNTTEAFLKGGKGAVKAPEQEWQSLSEMAAAGSSEPGPRRFLVRRLQNYKAPAAELSDLVQKTKELKKEGDVYSSDLTEAGAKELLSFGGRRGGNAPEPKNAKGSLKVWLKDGVPSKYQVKVGGTVNFNGEDRDIDRTTTIELNNVGTTKVEVPEAAQKKLS